jgi:RHS repeat-associated protein
MKRYKVMLGSIIKLTDADGTAVFEASYDAWGNQTITNGTFEFHRGYTGHEHLPEFGLINMNGRMYDPILGRFLSPDPFVQMPDFSQNFNRYAYCLNNPFKYTDPSGENWKYYGDYQGWEKRSGSEKTVGWFYTTGETKYRAGEFSQTVGYKKVGLPGSLGADVYNDLWGDRGDRFRTSRVLLNAGLFNVENILFTGDPGLKDKDRFERKIEQCGPNKTYIQNPDDPYAPNPNKYRHGILSARIGPVSFGLDSEKIRYVIQNMIVHNMTDSRYFRYERWKKDSIYFQFGGW